MVKDAHPKKQIQMFWNLKMNRKLQSKQLSIVIKIKRGKCIKTSTSKSSTKNKMFV